MIADALRRADIEPRHFGSGTQRLPCPRCAAEKYRSHDSALALLIEDGHAVFYCHRCNFKGAINGEQARLGAENRAIRTSARHDHHERTRHAMKAKQAQAIWGGAAPASADHTYLVRKRLPPLGLREVARFQSLEHALLVPMRDASGSIVNLQGVDRQGEKRFLAGALARGAFCYVVGEWQQRGATPVAIGEGWATVAAFCSLYPAFRGIGAMSAANLPRVARIVREKFVDAKIVICGDADAAGMRAAGEAAASVQAEICVPGNMGTDWADFRLKNHAS